MEDSMSDADAITNIIEAIRVELEESEGPDDVVLEYSDAVKLLAEIDRLCGELAAARAEPQRPAAIVRLCNTAETEVHAFEVFKDALNFIRQAKSVWAMKTDGSWTWHPARAAGGEGGAK
jgi:hypothetical protein